MAPRQQLPLLVDRLLKDLMDLQLPDIVTALTKQNFLWWNMDKFELKKNMRAGNDNALVNYVRSTSPGEWYVTLIILIDI